MGSVIMAFLILCFYQCYKIYSFSALRNPWHENESSLAVRSIKWRVLAYKTSNNFLACITFGSRIAYLKIISVLLLFMFLAQTPALHWQTEYTHDYRGARGKPSTTERWVQSQQSRTLLDVPIAAPWLCDVKSYWPPSGQRPFHWLQQSSSTRTKEDLLTASKRGGGG